MRVETIFAITVSVKWDQKSLFDERFLIFRLYIQNLFENFLIDSDHHHHRHRRRRHHHHYHYHQHHTLDLNTTKRLKQILVASRKLIYFFTKVYWFLSWNRVYDDSNTQDIMKMSVNRGTSIVPSLKEHLKLTSVVFALTSLSMIMTLVFRKKNFTKKSQHGYYMAMATKPDYALPWRFC